MLMGKLRTWLLLLTIGLLSSTSAKKQHHKHSQSLRSHGHRLGIPWGCSPECMKGMWATKCQDVHWYHHWQDGKVSDLDNMGIEYVPTFWGPTKFDKWNSVKAQIKHKLPKCMLAFNEPDVQGQADLGPAAAAKLWMQELQPYAKKGVQVSSPQICWDLQWLQTFMTECKKLGCHISFIAIHWYGSWQDFDKFTNWVSTIHDSYGLPIWITEYGITQASGGTQQDITNFHIKAVKWMQQTGYVQRSAWLGGFPVNDKPDPYPNALNSYFNADGSARSLFWWAATQSGGSSTGKREEDEGAVELLARDTSASASATTEEKHDDPVETKHYYDENHCDYRCQLREASIEKHKRKQKGVVHVDDKQVCIDTPSKLDKEEREKLAVCLKSSGLTGQKSKRKT